MENISLTSGDAAIEAIREKSFDFFPKPVKIEDLKVAIQKALGN